MFYRVFMIFLLLSASYNASAKSRAVKEIAKRVRSEIVSIVSKKTVGDVSERSIEMAVSEKSVEKAIEEIIERVVKKAKEEAKIYHRSVITDMYGGF